MKSFGHLFESIGRFLIWNIVLLIAAFIGPVLFLFVPFILIAVDPHGSFYNLSVFFKLLGPLTCACWTLIALLHRRYKRITADGTIYRVSIGGMVAGTGYMLLGFFGSIITEVVFSLMFNVPNGHPFGLVLYFAGLIVAAFFPLVIVYLTRTKKVIPPETDPYVLHCQSCPVCKRKKGHCEEGYRLMFASTHDADGNVRPEYAATCNTPKLIFHIQPNGVAQLV
jgi:hypothetical protein